MPPRVTGAVQFCGEHDKRYHGEALRFLIKTCEVLLFDLLFSGVKRQMVRKHRSRNLTLPS
jgi:hypothetical protein